MKRKRKILALMLVLAMVLSVIPADTFRVFADDKDSESTGEIASEVTPNESEVKILTEDELEALFASDDVTENVVTEETTNEVTADKNTTDEEITTKEEVTTEEISTEEVTTEVVTTEETTTEATTEKTEIVTEEDASDNDAPKEEDNFVVFDHYYSTIDETLVNTKELLVQTDDSSIFTKNTNIISNYDDMYMISCESVEEARFVYSYYVDKVTNISDMSNVFELSDEETEDTADMTDINEGDDAIANLNEIDTTPNYSDYIALIDSGADADIKVSVLDDDGSDTNGHGTKMLGYIKEEAPQAKVISIKAFDGKSSNVANIYAAIKLAIEYKVAIINLSFVGSDIESNSIIKDVINEAIDNGITVVGAAGNYNTDAKYYIPGCINDVIVVGSCDKDFNITSHSNFGENVDYFVLADSTSEATARMSGILTTYNYDETQFLFIGKVVTGELYAKIMNDVPVTVLDFILQISEITSYDVSVTKHDSPDYSDGSYGFSTAATYSYENKSVYCVVPGVAGPGQQTPSGTMQNKFRIVKLPETYYTNTVDGNAINLRYVICALKKYDYYFGYNNTARETATSKTFNGISIPVVSGNGYADAHFALSYYFSRFGSSLWNANHPQDSFTFGLVNGVDVYGNNRSYNNTTEPSLANLLKQINALGKKEWESANSPQATVYIFLNNEGGWYEGSTVNAQGQQMLSYEYSDVPTKPYYMAIKKTDTEGHLMNGVTFGIKVNGTQIRDDAGREACVYTGYYNPISNNKSNGWTDFRGDVKTPVDTNRITFTNITGYTHNGQYGDGYALIYLGDFATKPTVQIAEKWAVPGTTSDRAYWINQTELVTYNGATRTPTNEVRRSPKDYGFKTVNNSYTTVDASKIIAASSNSDAAKQGAMQLAIASPVVQNNKATIKYYMAIKKVDNLGYPVNNVPFKVSVATNYSDNASSVSWKPTSDFSVKTGYAYTYNYPTSGSTGTVSGKTNIYKTASDGTVTTGNVTWQGEAIPRQDGVALIYLGEYDKADKVIFGYREAGAGDFSTDAYIVGTKPIKVSASDLTLDTTWYFHKIVNNPNGFDTASEALSNYASDPQYKWNSEGSLFINATNLSSSNKGAVVNSRTPKPYYVAFVKTGSYYKNASATSPTEGYLSGATFNLSFSYIKADGSTGTFNSNGTANNSFAYTGWYQEADLSTNKTLKSFKNIHEDSYTTPTVGTYTGQPIKKNETNHKERGIAVIYLGSFYTAPTNVVVTENWKSTNSHYGGTSGTGVRTNGIYFTDGTVVNPDVDKDFPKMFSNTTGTIDITSTLRNSYNDAYGQATNKKKVNNGYSPKLTIIKNTDSKYANYVKTNPNYSLTGIQFGIYTSSSNAISDSNRLATFTITDGTGNNKGTGTVTSAVRGTNGTALTVSNGKVDIGPLMGGTTTSKTFYVKEIFPSNYKGNYDTDAVPPQSVVCTLSSDNNSVTFTNKISGDPLYIEMDKFDEQGNVVYATTSGESVPKMTFTFYEAELSNNYTRTGLQNRANTTKHSATITFNKLTKQKDIDDDGVAETVYYYKLTTLDIFNSFKTWYPNMIGLPIGYLTIDETTMPVGYTAYNHMYITDSNGTRRDMGTTPVIKVLGGNKFSISNGTSSTFYTMQGTGLSTGFIHFEAREGDNSKFSSSISDRGTNGHVGVMSTNDKIRDAFYIEGVPYGKAIEYSATLYRVSDGVKYGTTVTDTYTSLGTQKQTINIDFDEFDSSAIKSGKTLAGDALSCKIVLRWVNDNGTYTNIGTHNNDLTDVNQTVYYPNGHTNATGIIDTKFVRETTDTVSANIHDDFTFNNFYVGTTYKIKASVHLRNADGTDGNAIKSNGSTGDSLVRDITLVVNANGTCTATDDATGSTLTVSDVTKSNQNQTVNGRIRISFALNNKSYFDGKTVTIFETVKVGNTTVLTHTNINDVEQEVHFMKMTTNITDADTLDNVAVRKTNDTLVDVVTFEKVPYSTSNTPTTVTVRGVLHDFKTKEQIKVNNASVIVYGTFDVDKNGNISNVTGVLSDFNPKKDANTKTVSGTFKVTFTFDSTGLFNKKVVSYIRAYITNGSTNYNVSLHEDINDGNETVYYTNIHTNATDINTKTNVATLGQTTVVDRVTCENLVYDKIYRIDGTVHKKKANGTDDGVLNQTGAKVSTYIKVSNNGTVSVVDKSGNPTTNDKVTNINFKAGSYANTVSGTIDLLFTIDTSELVGKDIVVFEDLYHNEIKIDYHNNIADLDQTIHVPDGGTTAMDNDTKDHVGTVKEGETLKLTDTVSLTNIAFGHSYSLSGIIMDKKTKNALEIDGNTITSSAKFTVDDIGNVTSTNTINKITDVVKSDSNNDGIDDVVSFKIDLIFELNSKDLYNKDIVVYETGYYADTDIVIFKEDDITNLGQTIHFPDVKTKATDDTYKKHTGTVETESTLTEQSMLYNLVWGQSYDVIATLCDHDGNELKVNDKAITKTATITISEDGQTITAVEKGTTTNLVVSDIIQNNTNKTLDLTVAIPFTYDSNVVSGTNMVVFEDLVHNDVTVRTHHEKDDKGEQIHYYKLNILKIGVDEPVKVIFTVKFNGETVYFEKLDDGKYNVLQGEKDGCVTEISPNADGKLEMNGFDVGDYVFTEIKTENGKNLLAEAFTATFDQTSEDDGTLQFKLSSGRKSVTVEPLDEEVPDTIDITIENNSVVQLKTGGNGVYMYFMISLLLMLGACVLIIRQRKVRR